MYLCVVTALLAIVTASALTLRDDPPKGYHQLVGVPLAARIKAKERRVLMEKNSRSMTDDFDKEYFDQYSFYAGLLISIPRIKCSYCGSSLLSSNRLLTAAHCWNDGYVVARKFIVVLGTPYLFHGGLRIKTTDVIPHPEYNATLMKHDIAIIQISHLLLNTTIFPIALQGLYTPPVPEFQKNLGRVVGFGKFKTSMDIQYNIVDVTLLPVRVCQEYFPFPLDPEIHLCSRTEKMNGTCIGDSGSPLIAYSRPYLIGVLSSQTDSLCDGEGRGRSLFTNLKIPEYMDFIKSHVALPIYEYHYETQQDPPITMENITATVNYTHFISHTYNMTGWPKETTVSPS